jgi:S1-C subfamily serine protease
MKLYSRGQLVFFAIISACIAIGLIAGAGILFLRKYSAQIDAQVAELTDDVFGLINELPLQPENPLLMNVNTADLFRYTDSERENIAVYERLNSAVVNITTETVAINWFLEPVPQDGSSGSGSIIDTRGYVVTNNHVIEKAYKVFINLADGSQYEGSVIGTDPENDIAVIKFDPPRGVNLRTIPFGESDNLKVGQKVLAIGNPFALERTLTVGIVSGLGRPIQTTNNRIIQGMIQTDASINPGNSGGPLLDSQGRMIGINTMIYSTSGGSVGVGFAIPVNTAKRVVAELIETGRVRRGMIDATMIQIFPALVSYAKLSVSSGLLVSRTRQNGLAERAGLRPGTEPVRYGSSVIYLGGDIITSVDGRPTDTLADLYAALEDNKPGETVAVEILRGSTKIQLRIMLAERE